MHDPKQVEVLNPKATYELPRYKVTKDGLEKVKAGEILRFVKGSKNDPTQFRQEGVVTESVVTAVKMYLEENNVGKLENEYTTQMIKHLQAVLDLIDERAANRAGRGVQGTYKE
jgi:hypothetical protein